MILDSGFCRGWDFAVAGRFWLKELFGEGILAGNFWRFWGNFGGILGEFWGNFGGILAGEFCQFVVDAI
jgi:hypothetical protein